MVDYSLSYFVPGYLRFHVVRRVGEANGKSQVSNARRMTNFTFVTRHSINSTFVGGTEMRSFMGRDILSLKEFERNEFFHVFEVAKELEPIAKSRRNSDMLKDKTLVTAFYQPSTRTRLAHEAAMHRLGGHVTGFADAKMTRAGDFYQESIKDTVKMLEFYGAQPASPVSCFPRREVLYLKE